MRGNHLNDMISESTDRSIPAHAGQPKNMAKAGGPVAVYPRACGATQSGVQQSGRADGLSPRMRGNRFFTEGTPIKNRSIPAHAGQPDGERQGNGLL